MAAGFVADATTRAKSASTLVDSLSGVLVIEEDFIDLGEVLTGARDCSLSCDTALSFDNGTVSGRAE